MSIKITILLLLCVLVSFVAAKDGGEMTNKDPSKQADAQSKGDESLEEGGSQKKDTGTLAIQKWMTPELATGFGTVLFILVIANLGFGLLGAIQTPPYQMPKKDQQGEETNPFANIWGQIEK